MITESTNIATVLKKNNYSYTQPRRIVFSVLENFHPLTMAELVKSIGNDIDRASVYRTVELFEKLDIVNRIYVGWKYKLELSDLFQPHHHHLTCVKCGKVISLEEDRVVEETIQMLSLEHSFKISDHQIEVRGLCPTCQ